MIEGEYLLQAVRDTLRTNLKNVTTFAAADTKSIQIMPDDRIPAMAGEEFIGIYASDFRNVHPPQSITTKESYNVSIGITRRLHGQPLDRVGDTIYTEDTTVLDRLKPSMLKRARNVIDLIDGIFAIITTTNANLVTGECPFITPLGLVSADSNPEFVEEDHFFTDPDSNSAPKGLFMEIIFGGAELVRVK